MNIIYTHFPHMDMISPCNYVSQCQYKTYHNVRITVSTYQKYVSQCQYNITMSILQTPIFLIWVYYHNVTITMSVQLYPARPSLIRISHLRHIPFKLQLLRDPSNRETRIPRYKFKSKQNLNLNLYREIPRNLSISI